MIVVPFLVTSIHVETILNIYHFITCCVHLHIDINSNWVKQYPTKWVALECAEALQWTIARSGFLYWKCRIAFEPHGKGVKQRLFRAVTYQTWAVSFEVSAAFSSYPSYFLWSSTWIFFLPPIFLIMTFVLTTLSLNFALVRQWQWHHWTLHLLSSTLA